MKNTLKGALVFAVAMVVAVVFALVLSHEANSIPAAKKAYQGSSAKSFKDPHLRITWAPGAAANASILVPGITSSDQIISVTMIDTTKFRFRAWPHTDSTYIQANDSIRDGLATDTGFVEVLWHDAQP